METTGLVPEQHLSAVQHFWYGHGQVPTKRDFEFSWKAVKAVAAADGVLSDPERLHLLGRMCTILTPPDVIELVMEHDEHSEAPERLMARVNIPDDVRPGAGAWVAYQGLSVAFADGELAAGEIAAIRRTAATMGVAAETVDALAQLCRDEAAIRRRRIELLNSTIPVAFRFAHDGERAAPSHPVPPQA